MNLSSINIPSEVHGLLQLGEGFCLPTHTHNSKIASEFIKHIENNICKLQKREPKLVADIRNHSIPIIQNLYHRKLSSSDFEKTIKDAFMSTKNFLKNNSDMLLTRADKGNSTVAIDRSTYNKKINDLLNDANTYTTVKRNPINKLTTDLHTLLTRWKGRNYITTEKYKRLNSFVPILPRAYGLPKIHKENYPFRIIVSCINTPLYSIASFLHDIIHKSIPPTYSQVINSFHLIKRLQNITIDKQFRLMSYRFSPMYHLILRWRELEKDGFTYL